MLDDECIRPGDVSDATFLKKLNQEVVSHPRFDTREKVKSDKTLQPNMFRLKHYAGDVIYTVEGFIEKNTDSLYKDMLYALNASQKPLFKELFPEAQNQTDLKRPETVATQFRSSMQHLMSDLMSKNPHYVRCLKPNNSKEANKFDMDLVKHQCRYLGLLENVRVRRAGFCYRLSYTKFLERFKMLCKKTWPNWKGSAQDGVLNIMKALGISAEEFACGGTKIFIKSPKTILFLEKKRLDHRHVLVSKIKATWKAYHYHKKYLDLKSKASIIAATWKMHQVTD